MVGSPLIKTPLSSINIALKGSDFEHGLIHAHGRPSTCLLHRQCPIRFDFLCTWTTLLSPMITSSNMRLLTSYGNLVQSPEFVCWIFEGSSPLPFSGRGNVRARLLLPSKGPDFRLLRLSTLCRCWYGDFWRFKRLRVLCQREVPT
jgi:hypothetical protein